MLFTDGALHLPQSTAIGTPAHLLLAVSTSLVLLAGYLVMRLKGVRGDGSRTATSSTPLVDLPILGMLPSMLLNVHRLHDWVAKELEGKGLTTWVRGPWFSGMKFVATADPVLTKHVSSTKYTIYMRGNRFREIVEPLGMGVITADCEEWRAMRKVVVDLLHRPAFQTTVRELTRETLEKMLLPVLARAARAKRPVDMQDMLLRCSFRVMCSAILGLDLGSLSPSLPSLPFMDAFGEVEEIIITRFLFPRGLWRFFDWLRIGPPRRLAEYTQVVDDFLYQIIATRKEELQRGEVDASQRFNLLTEFLRSDHETVDETGKLSRGYSTKYVRDATLELLASGWRSTGIAMSRLLWLVSRHPSAEAGILNELAGVDSTWVDIVGDHLVDTGMVGKTWSEGARGMASFDPEGLSSCVYLNAAIHESLRLYAPIPFTSRCSLQPDVLPSGEKLAAGVTVLLPVFSVGRMKGIWGPDASMFKPERWISGEGKMKDVSSYEFAVFGAGPRGCLGRKVSMAIIKPVMASVIRNFSFTAVESTDPSANKGWLKGKTGEIPFGSFEQMNFHVHAR